MFGWIYRNNIKRKIISIDNMNFTYTGDNTDITSLICIYIIDRKTGIT